MGGVFGSVLADMPIGLMSMSAYVKKYAGADTLLVDFNVVLNKLDCFDYGSFSELYQDVLSQSEWQNYRPDIVGISSLFTPSYQNVIDIA